MFEPFVGIVVPCYNAETTIERTLKSIGLSHYANYEVILVNDGSTDRTLDTLYDYASRDSRLKVINQKNGGVSSARNSGVAATSADYVAFLDADDVFFDKSLSERMKIFVQEDDPEMIGVFCPSIMLGENLEILRQEPLFNHLLPQNRLYFSSFFDSVFNPSSVILKKTMFTNACGFDESLCPAEDFEFWHRIMRNGGYFRKAEECLVGWVQHPASAAHAHILKHHKQCKKVFELINGPADGQGIMEFQQGMGGAAYYRSMTQKAFASSLMAAIIGQHSAANEISHDISKIFLEQTPAFALVDTIKFCAMRVLCRSELDWPDRLWPPIRENVLHFLHGLSERFRHSCRVLVTVNNYLDRLAVPGPARESARAMPAPPDCNDLDSIELLPVSLIDEHRDIADMIHRKSAELKVGLGWHYLLDLIWIIKYIRKLPQGSVILDAGAGNGLLQFILADMGFRVISADFSERIVPHTCLAQYNILHADSGRKYDNEYIRHLSTEFQARHHDNEPEAQPGVSVRDQIALCSQGTIIYYRVDICAMEQIADASIDCVVSVSALEHNSQENLSAAVRELERVLKPGSAMLITVSATDKQDWYHDQSKGWCFTDTTLTQLFSLQRPRSNFDLFSRHFKELQSCSHLQRNLDPNYYRSGNNGMPWGKWDPRYQPVGIRKQVAGTEVRSSMQQGAPAASIEAILSRPLLSIRHPQSGQAMTSLHPPATEMKPDVCGDPAPMTGYTADMANVVINFHRGDQGSAGKLLDLLLAVDEGIDCTYHLQYGAPPDTLAIRETIERFRKEKEVVLHFDLPDIIVPTELVENDPNLKEYPGNQARRTKNQKHSILQWNLCVFKFIQLIDSFLMLEPDCVILKKGWLLDIYTAYRNSNFPIFGHLKSGMINGSPMPTHWAGCSVYNGRKLRELDLERYFYERYENPWWRYRNLNGTTNANNCLYGPVFSGYDISYDYFLFAQYWREMTGNSDPFQWPLRQIENRDDLIYCDFHSTLTAEEIYDRFRDKLPLLHGVKSDDSRLLMTEYFSEGGASAKTGTAFHTTCTSNAADTENLAALPQQSLQRCLSPEELFVMTNRRMGLFRNRHKGQRCVIIGNGPSLNKMDLSFLENEITFGMNRIFLLFDTWKFRPTYYVSVNPLVIEQSAEEILKIDAPKFLSHKGIPFFNDPGEIHFLQSIPQWFFSKDPRNGICEGWTVTYVAMQLAYFMGFEEVVLIGVDHHFFTQGDPNKEVVSEGDDPNHFHPDYFGKGVRWHLPDLERSEGSYRMAKQAFEAENRRIIDATVGGKLAVFPKADYRELFHVANSADGRLSSVSGENRENESVISSSGLRISVITPSFNQGNYIEQTIRSVIYQKYPDIEHFVIDGGSSDATLDILKRYPQLNWVSETDRGQADALNKGFRKATGDIIAWINSDDWYEPGAFRAVADFFTANPEKNIVMGDCNLVDRNGAIFDKVINHERGFDELKQHWISRSIPTQPAIFFRKNLLDQFGMLDESLHFAMDYDLWMRFAQKNRLYHLEQTVANYRFHNDAKGGDQNWSKFLPDCLTVYDRYCQPQVSVVIPCYNYAHYLGEAVQSVLAQTYQELEIIIVNDGSTDNTIGVADKIIAAHPHIRIRLINQANSGQPAASRNKGISEAKGKYILPLDADDMIDPTMVQKMMDILDRNDTVDIVYCDTIRFGDVNNSYHTKEWNLQRLASVNTMNYCALFRRKVWDDIGGYRLDCGYEDWDFWISAAEKGFKGHRIPEYLFYYRIKQSGRLLLDQQNDARNKAKIVNNHPNLYDESTNAWAKNILTADFDKGKKTQILFVVHNFPPHWYAGVEIYSYQLATSLIKMGIDVSVLYPFHREGMVIPEIEEASLDGIKIFRLLSDHSLPEHGGLTSQIANEKQERVFADFLQLHNFNSVHFHHTRGMPFSFITIARNHGCPVCVTLHDYWFLCVGIHLYDISTNSLCSGPDSPDRCADCLLTKIRQTPSLDDRSILEKWIQFRTSHAVDILRNTDCIVSPSHYLADIHQKYGISQSIEVSPLGLNSIKKNKRVTGSPLVFAFLGNIHELKNAYLLAEVFKGVTGEARLLYFGSGEKHYIDKLIAEIEGDERITYRGGYSPSQLADILNQLDIVVVPSISENYPLVVREALSAGVPVLASRVGGIPEIVTHLRNGILFDPADKQELELWLQTFVDRPELILELKMNILPVKTMDQDANEWVERYARISSPPENVEHTLQPTTETGTHGTNVTVYSLDAPQEACAQIRLLSPCSATGGFIKCQWGVTSDDTNCTTNLDMIDQADIIVIQRFYPRKGTIPFIEKMLSSGKPVIYEVDDLLTDLPEGDSRKFWARETAELLPWLLPRVTAITVSTPLLAKAFSSMTPSIHVIPNLVDTDLFRPASPKSTGPVVIGFSATSPQVPDLLCIEKALFRVAERYGNNVAFSFIGHATPGVATLPGFRYVDFQKDYVSYGNALSSSGIDIAIVPLQDNRFNSCKSNIKWLEYSACGIAGIYADLPPYNTSVEHGTNGVLVNDDPDNWFQAMCLLIDHPEFRHSIAQQANSRVVAQHSLKEGAHALHNLYESIANGSNCTKIA